MNKFVFLLQTAAILLIFGFVVANHDITGHWISYTPDSTKVLVDFNADHTFKVTVNGATENEGQYRFANDTMLIYDNTCGMQIPGAYKINFFTEDSLRFDLIDDSCAERAGEINGGTLKRLSR